MIRPCLKQILTTQLKLKWDLIEIMISLMISTMFLVFVLFSPNARAWAQGLVHANHTLYQLSYMPITSFHALIFFDDYDDDDNDDVCVWCVCVCVQAGVQVWMCKPEDNFTCWATSPTLFLISHWYQFLQIMSIKFLVLPNFAYFITYLVPYR